MKACLLRTPAPVESRPLELAEVETPTAGEGELLLRVSACGVCRTDLHVVEGELAVRKSPVVPGHQVVGRVEAVGAGAEGFGERDGEGFKAGDGGGFKVGDRVGLAWLNETCGVCRFCRGGRENLCERAEFTGWTRDGGYAEFVRAPARFVYPLPEGFGDVQAAPLLCAGIIGYRALRLTGLREWKGARLGIYGFGAAGHVCIQIARSRGAEVYVMTRDRERHQALAEELGAAWTGGASEEPPVKLDAAVIFAPAGELVPVALKALDKGGALVTGGIHMSDLPPLPYRLLYGERVVRSVANNTREDGREFLAEAARVPVRTSVQTYTLAEAGDALVALKRDAVRGAAVLLVS
ncbi:MAG: zinc-dependent alcohol dehydrogenase family protein [Acidobacteriota bacterium]|nr:zinc-dependent alcohol dehydrogenase family protein [Acidobacteriota bacterium]